MKEQREAQENWMPAQNGRLNWVTKFHFALASSSLAIPTTRSMIELKYEKINRIEGCEQSILVPVRGKGNLCLLDFNNTRERGKGS